ncbi:MAG: DUF456 domain-containing protein [Candidatus Omnitrophota bacterium]|nr:DUF456 domain-containing protein [Candidatus Omnitrophota bacterium]
MEYAAFAVLILFSLIGFFGIFFTSFGTFFILMGALAFAFMTDFAIFDVITLSLIAVLYAVGEVLEYVAVVIGAKKLGASNGAVVGAIIGGIVGAGVGALFFGIGAIPGTFLGIFLGAVLVELLVRKDLGQAIKAGVGGLIGRIGSIFAKLLIAVCIYLIMGYRIVEFFRA